MSLKPDPNLAERRTEARRMAHGLVKLRPEDFACGTTHGRLLDRSDHGFRVQHGLKGLTNGHFVHFEFRGGAGRARVIWTRIAGEHVESGFLVASYDEPAGNSGV